MRTVISEIMVVTGTGCAAVWVFQAALGLSLFSPAVAAVGCALIIAGCAAGGVA